MKANELRIGNYVYYKNPDYKNIPRKIKYTQDPNLVGIEKVSVNRITYNEITPIPITEDLYDMIEDQLMSLDLNYSYSFVTNTVFIYFENSNIVLNYLHQLQNFFFEITKEYLDIKIEVLCKERT